MKSSTRLLGSAAVLLCGLAMFAQSPSASARGHVIVPASSIPLPGRPATDLLIFVPEGAPVAQSSPYPNAETPGSLACVYKLTKQVKGCPINRTFEVPKGGANAIAVVEEGSDPTLQSDLDIYSETFGLPKTTLEIVCVGSGGCPDDGWSSEMALDTQIAHAMAPKAKIYVVECAGSCTTLELFNTEKKAGELVAAAGGGEVSNSWRLWVDPPYEHKIELQYDKYFQHKGVVYFSAAGDTNSVRYPATSPYVVAAGGTQINRDSNGDFTNESAWSSSGGGPSAYEPRPSYQDIVKKIVGNHKGTPDVSFDASENSCVATLDTYGYGGWVCAFGTSVSAPALAGIFNGGDHFYQSTPDELAAIYKEYGNPTEYKEWFRNITIGNNAYQCKKGYTFCAGVGAPLTFKGK